MSDSLDTAMLLYMLDGAAPVYGRLKVQKTPFFVEYDLGQSGLSATTFSYLRWRNGPFSQQVWDSLDFLKAQGFLQPHRDQFGLTDRGLFLLDLVASLGEIPENKDVFSVIDSTLRHCKARSGQALMAEAYDIEIEPEGMPGTKTTIRDIPNKVSILAPESSSLEVPSDLAKIIATELRTTPEELEAGKKSFAAKEREALARLLAAIPEGLPS